MSDEIRPALTADEWAKTSFIRPDSTFTAYGSDGRVFEAAAYNMAAECLPDSELDIGDTIWTGEPVASLIALANYALPDDSPYKITQADVELIRDSAEEFRVSWPVGERGLLAVAAKLAALLPPQADTMRQ